MASARGLSRRDFLNLVPAFCGALLLRPEFIDRSEFADENLEEFLASHEVNSCDAARGVVCMTYDDMNSAEKIDCILDAYRDRECKTTFFLPGGYSRNYLTLQNYAQQVERIVDEGHVLGCHGLVHEPLTGYSSAQIRSDIEQWLDIVQNIIPGYRVKWLRFPYGDRNQRTKETVAEYGLQSVMWTFTSNGTDEATYNRVTSLAQPGDIILSHTHRYYDAFYAGRILDYFLSNNYKIESIETGLESENYYRPDHKTKNFDNNISY